MTDLIKLLPDGASVIAVIVVVVIFLRNQKDYNEAIRTVTKDFADRIDVMQRSFEQQIDRLSNNYLTSEARNQEQIQQLFNDCFLISKETVAAVKQLEGAVQALTGEVRKYKQEEKK